MDKLSAIRCLLIGSTISSISAADAVTVDGDGMTVERGRLSVEAEDPVSLPDEGGEIFLSGPPSHVSGLRIDRYKDAARLFFNDPGPMRFDIFNHLGGGLEMRVQGALEVTASARVHGELFVQGTTTIGPNLVINGSDLVLGASDGRGKGAVTHQRALVHIDSTRIASANVNDTLVVNFAGDFEGGVVVSGPGLLVQGELSTQGGIELNAGPRITAVSDDDQLGDASASAVPTERAVKAYVDQSVSQATPAIGAILVQDRKDPGAFGGGFASGDWRIRDLNVEVADALGRLSLSGNVMTLAPGRYLLEAECPAYRVNGHQARLFNVDAGLVEALGTSEYASATDGGMSDSTVTAYLDIAVATRFRLEHRCQTTDPDNGFGTYAGGWGDNIYSTVEILVLE